jgi:tripartite ATP-independent transporter DctP family solute receptor
VIRVWALVFILVCAGAGAEGAETKGTPPVILRMAELHPADYPTSRGDLEFARQVERMSQGRLRLEVYFGGVLGDEVSVMEQLAFGGIDLARVSIASVEPYQPRLAALFMPYLYRDEVHLWKVLTGPVGHELLDDLGRGPLVGVGWFEAGSRCFYTAERPVRRASDLANLRIRVQESPSMMVLVRALGGTPVPLAFSSVYQGLRTGFVNGAENNLATYYASGHYQVAPYFTVDDHARLPEMIVGSATAFADLSPGDLELLRRAAAAAAVFQRAAWATYETEIRAKLVAAGVSFVFPDDLAGWRARARTVWDLQAPNVRSLLVRIQAVR